MEFNQEMLNMMLAPPDIMACKKALFIQPHPDDNEVACGGIIPKLVENGCEVHYLTITDGQLGALSPLLTGKNLAKQRKVETENAGNILGVSAYHYFNYADGSLDDVPELAGKIAELIREYQFEAVFCPDPYLPYEAHNDHIVTGKAAAQALISCNLVEYPKGTKTKAFTPSAMGFYFTNKPNTIINVDETFELKFEAMAAHKSQLPEQLLALYRAYFTMRGMNLAKEYDFNLGEGLKVLSPLHLHCFPEAEMI